MSVVAIPSEDGRWILRRSEIWDVAAAREIVCADEAEGVAAARLLMSEVDVLDGWTYKGPWPPLD